MVDRSYIVSCGSCGARYRRTDYKHPVRDSDSYSCRRCGNEMASWSGGVIPTFELLEDDNKLA